MPQMSGRCFADWMGKASPGTKVVFISGYLQESLHPGDRRDQEMFFLPKPFDPRQLATKIREALDALTLIGLCHIDLGAWHEAAAFVSFA